MSEAAAGKGGKGEKKKKNKPAVSKSSRAGLQFSVGRIARFLKKGRYAPRIGAGAPVYCAAVIEYLVAEILELAGDAAKNHDKKRISPRHIQLAIRQDSEFHQLLQRQTIAHGGVIPNIHLPLIPEGPYKEKLKASMRKKQQGTLETEEQTEKKSKKKGSKAAKPKKQKERSKKGSGKGATKKGTKKGAKKGEKGSIKKSKKGSKKGSKKTSQKATE